MTDHEQAKALATLANELDQLFRQRHTMADVEHLLKRALAEARREAIDDPECPMAGRHDLGHGKDGFCDIRKEPCPAKCRQKEIASLHAQINTLRLIDIPEARREGMEKVEARIREYGMVDFRDWLAKAQGGGDE